MSTIDETTKWTFPDVTYLAENALKDLPFISKLKEQEQVIDALNLTVETKDEEIMRLTQEIAELHHQQALLTAAVQKTAENFNAAIKKINEDVVSDSTHFN